MALFVICLFLYVFSLFVSSLLATGSRAYSIPPIVIIQPIMRKASSNVPVESFIAPGQKNRKGMNIFIFVPRDVTAQPIG